MNEPRLPPTSMAQAIVISRTDDEFICFHKLIQCAVSLGCRAFYSTLGLVHSLCVCSYNPRTPPIQIVGEFHTTPLDTCCSRHSSPPLRLGCHPPSRNTLGNMRMDAHSVIHRQALPSHERRPSMFYIQPSFHSSLVCAQGSFSETAHWSRPRASFCLGTDGC